MQLKCYHELLEADIKSGRAKPDADSAFFKKAAERLHVCNQSAKVTNEYGMNCLFSPDEDAPDHLDRIVTCVNDSFERNGDYESDNKMLRKDKQWARNLNLNYHPTVTINDFTYRGALTFKDIHNAICAAFSTHHHECEADHTLLEEDEPMASTRASRMEKAKAFITVFALITVTFLLIICGVTAYQKNQSKSFI